LVRGCSTDFDGDGDADGDGHADVSEPDACQCRPLGSVDVDSDGICDDEDTDLDDDGVNDDVDNCLGLWNPIQEDLDEDGRGDLCDPTDERARIDAVAPRQAVSATRGYVRGAYFGATAGQLRLDGGPVAIESWTDTLITLTWPLLTDGTHALAVQPAGAIQAGPAYPLVASSQSPIEMAPAHVGRCTPVSQVSPGGFRRNLVFTPDGATVYTIQHAAIEQWRVLRDAGGTILDFVFEGYVGTARSVDGGIDVGPDGAIFGVAYPDPILNRMPLDGTEATTIDLVPSGVVASNGGGAIHFDPVHLGEDALMFGWSSGIRRLHGTVTGGVWTLSSATLLSSTNGWEGAHFVPAGPHAGKLIASHWSAGQLMLLTWPGLQAEVLATVGRPYGMDYDPVTGDLLVGQDRNNGNVVVLRDCP